MNGARALLQLVVLLVVGLAAGIWTFVAPWALGYPGSGGVEWTRSTWSNVIVGAVVAMASAAALVIAAALMVRMGRRVGNEDHSERDAT
jgi:hypothetical protein